jgi:hypothetical protein
MNNGLAVNQIHGPGLGNKTGIFAWPLAACSGKVENGKFVSLSVDEAKEIMARYKRQRSDIVEFFEEDPRSDNWVIVIIVVISVVLAILTISFL